MSSYIFKDSDFIFTNAAWIILAENGSLSAVSSLLIMSIILRSSPEARFSAYHIIMLYMSFWDTIVSIAMAFNTIPMPSYVQDIYPFAGKTCGNVSTCEAQGFIIGIGSLSILFSSIILNVYYLCTFRYGMGEEKFKKRVLPFMLLVSMIFSIITPTAALKMKYFNPSPFRGFCWYNGYPFGCKLHYNDEGKIEGEGADCIRGDINDEAFYIFRLLGFVTVGVAFVMLVVS